MVRLLSAIVVLALGCGSAASARTYEGREAAALRCSNTLAYTAVALHAAQKIGEAQKNVMISISLSILERHVSGSWGQKKAALAVMRDRRDIGDTLSDYRKNAAKCLQQFPIN